MSANTVPPAANPFDLDNKASFTQCATRLKEAATENFIVRFNGAGAHCAIDIDQEEALRWLQRENRLDNQAVWLNFWSSASQKATIAAVAKKYGLSPRLTGLLCPARSSPVTSTPSASTGSHTSDGSSATTKDGDNAARATDVEKGVHSSPPPAPQKPQVPSGLKGIGFGDVVNDLWHFCSVDFGRHYIYVGYNALFTFPGSVSESSSKPSGERVWTSLLICDDGTVISAFERPIRPEAHAVARRNLLNVFKHLSSLYGQDDTQDALMKIRVRWNEHSAKSGAAYSENEAANLLFYYLFDDWLSTYALIARREHPYRDTLEHLRQHMFDAADVALIKKVHDVGRQLTVLKLMYQSYELIVSRLLHRQRSTTDLDTMPGVGGSHSRAGTFGSQNGTPASQMLLSESLLFDEDSKTSVKMSLSAVVRFERLLDRIRLYALTEIEECLKEKESLVLMVSFDSPLPTILLKRMPELQLGYFERVPSRREADQDDHLTGQSYHLIPSR